jgi:subtilisin
MKTAIALLLITAASLLADHIIILKPGAKARDVAGTHAIARIRTYTNAVNGFSGKVPEKRLEALKKDSRVLLVEEDVDVFAMTQTIPTGVRRVGTNAAARIDGVDERVDADVAILDTGIDLSHPDLNVFASVSFSTNNTTGNDGHGHGTHVAGIVGALDNDFGVVGVAPGVRLWAVKVLNDSGSGKLSDVIAGVDWVTANPEIQVANMSLGGLGLISSLRMAISNAVAKGIVFVVAAGNSSYEVLGADLTFETTDDFFPACYPECMTISAMVDTDGLPGSLSTGTTYGLDDTGATFSNYSRSNLVAGNPVTSPGAMIDVAAPGVNIYSTYKGGTYATMSGTSMASPHVAGAVALYIAGHARATNAAGVAAIRQVIIDAAQPQASWGTNTPNQNPFKDFAAEGCLMITNLSGSPVVSTNVPPPETPPPVPIQTNLTVRVTSNKTLYMVNETANLTATVTDSVAPLAGASVHWSVRTPKGKVIVYDNIANSSGVATYAYRINAKRDGSGTYTVTVSATRSGYNTASTSLTFRTQ